MHKRNAVVRTRNHSCCRKALNITYSECVSITLVTQHAKRIRHIILSSVVCPAVPYFSTLSHKWQDFRRNVAYLLTPWSRVLLEKLTGLQLVKKFPAFYGTQRFITALTSARHLPLSWASSIQSTHPHSISRRSILILSSHLCLGLPSGLLPSGFP